jgi:hypothetical protein
VTVTYFSTIPVSPDSELPWVLVTVFEGATAWLRASVVLEASSKLPAFFFTLLSITWSLVVGAAPMAQRVGERFNGSCRYLTVFSKASSQYCKRFLGIIGIVSEVGGGEQCMGRPYLLSDSHKTPVFSQSIITMLISHNQLHYLLHINFIKENIGMRKKRTPQNRKRITRDVQEARAKTNAKTEILQSIMPNILCK